MRTVGTQHRCETSSRLFDRGSPETVGVVVRLAVLHARVSVTQHLDDVVANDVGGGLEFGHTDIKEVSNDFGCVHCFVQDVALLAAGGAHQCRVRTIVGVLGGRGCTLR